MLVYVVAVAVAVCCCCWFAVVSCGVFKTMRQLGALSGIDFAIDLAIDLAKESLAKECILSSLTQNHFPPCTVPKGRLRKKINQGRNQVTTVSSMEGTK